MGKFATSKLAVAFVAASVVLMSGSLLVAAPGSAPAAKVGDFSVSLAKALELQGPARGFTADSATEALWKIGIRLPADSRKTLTEGDVVSALASLGFTVSTDNPSRVVSANKADTVVKTFVSSGAAAERIRGTRTFTEGNGGDDFNNGNGKGGKFKRKNDKSPTGPGDDL